MAKSYRELTVDGKLYRWKVGRKNIELRRIKKKSGKTAAKKIVSRPPAQRRWGLTTPQVETEGLNLAIFTDKDKCEAEFQKARETYKFCGGQVEMFEMPSKTVSVKPADIEALVRDWK